MKRCSRIIPIVILLTLATVNTAFSDSLPDPADGVTVIVFDKHDIHFDREDAQKFATDDVTVSDNGRVVTRSVVIEDFSGPMKVIARLAVYPIPKDERNVHDKWDRAGNIRLVVEGMKEIELVKFITSYGGFTEHEVDISHLAPLLKGRCTFKGSIDTWVSPAWKIDFSLVFTPDTGIENNTWATGILYEPSFNTRDIDPDGIETMVEIPKGLKTITLCYLVSGHCTDGRDADEFVSKDNVISVDGRVVYRFKPWRDDCRKFREVNPYCAKWSDGYWSSDYSRSGWCPGDDVKPLWLDLSDHLTPGIHTIGFNIENVRPIDEEGNFGYWRLSSYLTGR